MKVRLFLLCTFSGSLFAQGMPLPPVNDHSAYPASVANAPKPSAASTLYEILGRVEQLQVEVQQLRGQVEEQAYTITELKKRQNSIYSDLDQRLQAIESSGSAVSQPAPEAEAVAAESTAQPAPAVAPVAPVQTQPSAPQPEPAKPASAESEKQRYQQSYETLKNGHYSKAIAEFKQFLNDYPSGEYSDNAQYWLGEAYKVNREVSLSREAFNKLVTNYPNSPKVRDGLLKLGYIELEQNNIAKAREYFTRITSTYPGTTAAHLASKKLQQLDQNP